MMTTADYLQWLRSHRFARYCMVCRTVESRCRMFNHFGGARYDWTLERVVYPFDVGSVA